MITPEMINQVLTMARATFPTSSVTAKWSFTDLSGLTMEATCAGFLGPVSLKTISMITGQRSDPTGTLVLQQADVDAQAPHRGLKVNDRLSVTKDSAPNEDPTVYTVVFIPPSAGGILNVLIGPQYG
jgi:hypothetical protein